MQGTNHSPVLCVRSRSLETLSWNSTNWHILTLNNTDVNNVVKVLFRKATWLDTIWHILETNNADATSVVRCFVWRFTCLNINVHILVINRMDVIFAEKCFVSQVEGHDMRNDVRVQQNHSREEETLLVWDVSSKFSCTFCRTVCEMTLDYNLYIFVSYLEYPYGFQLILIHFHWYATIEWVGMVLPTPTVDGQLRLSSRVGM